MNDLPDYYAILEVPPTASTEQIRRSYRHLAFIWHEDRNPGNAEASVRMKAINEAVEILCDPHRREEYDKERRWRGGFYPVTPGSSSAVSDAHERGRMDPVAMNRMFQAAEARKQAAADAVKEAECSPRTERKRSPAAAPAKKRRDILRQAMPEVIPDSLPRALVVRLRGWWDIGQWKKPAMVVVVGSLFVFVLLVLERYPITGTAFNPLATPVLSPIALSHWATATHVPNYETPATSAPIPSATATHVRSTPGTPKPTATPIPTTYAGTGPYVTGCTTNSEDLYTTNGDSWARVIITGTVRSTTVQVGYADVWYSPKCGTNWTVTTNLNGPAKYEKACIKQGPPQPQDYCNSGLPYGNSLQVYGPGAKVQGCGAVEYYYSPPQTSLRWSNLACTIWH